MDAGTTDLYGVRVEPKVFLANERTFLNWLSMSVSMGSIASVSAPALLHCTPQAKSTAHLICTILLLRAKKTRPITLCSFLWG